MILEDSGSLRFKLIHFFYFMKFVQLNNKGEVCHFCAIHGTKMNLKMTDTMINDKNDF